MKRFVLYIGCLCLLLALGGCRSDRAAAAQNAPATIPPTKVEVHLETGAPMVTPEVLAALTKQDPHGDEEPEEDSILGYCISILDALPYAMDLDGDGAQETVSLAADEDDHWTVQVAHADCVARFPTEIRTDMPCDLWVGDLDEDGGCEIFLHGDLASDDYILYAWRHDLTPILFEPDDRFVRGDGEPDCTVFCGAVQGFEDGHIIVEGYVDMLGTHWGVRTLAIGDDGVIGPISTAWEFEEMDDRFLTVKKALTAYEARVRKDPGAPFPLEPGEKLYPLASDGCGRMWFKTAGGKTGVLVLTPDKECMWRIDGVPEEDCFEFLPYSG